jgi:hypothetical protein
VTGDVEFPFAGKAPLEGTGMTKQTRKQEKAVQKIDKAVRKAVDKGVSQAAIETTVDQAMAKTADNDPDASETAVEAKSSTRKIPGSRKTGDVTLKRGVIGSLEKPAQKSSTPNTKPIDPDSEKPSLKKLPGKRKPPTLTRKRDKSSE